MYKKQEYRDTGKQGHKGIVGYSVQHSFIRHILSLSLSFLNLSTPWQNLIEIESEYIKYEFS